MAEEIKHSQHVPQVWKNALTTKTLEENIALYKEWAVQYDSDLSGHGYDAPRVVAFELQRGLAGFCAGTDKKPTEFTFLDVGSGTGMVAEQLHPLGFRLIDALDTSQEMLDVAKSKGVYRSLICADGNNGSAVPRASYDVVVSVGTFTPGHLDGTAVESVLRYIKVGGFFAVALRVAYYRDPASKMQSTLRDLEIGGRIRLFALSPELPYHLSEPDVKFQCWLYQVTAAEA